jgi:hypothetical protein
VIFSEKCDKSLNKKIKSTPKMPRLQVWTLFILLNILANLFCVTSGLIYHNQIAVHVPGGEEVAKRSGMTNLGRIGDLQDLYLLESHLIIKR